VNANIKRRAFITLLGGAAAAWPLSARAQQPAMPVIGLLSARSPAVDTPLIAVIRQGLNDTGFIEGRNVAVDYRWANGQYDRLATLAADLVRHQVADFDGTTQKRLLSFRGDDEFTFTVPNPSGGGSTTTVIFRRAK
jgi:hypothetical protein